MQHIVLNKGWLNCVTPEILAFFLSIDTESINSDHHLSCGGYFEFSKRENIRDDYNHFQMHTAYVKTNFL